VLRIIGSKLDDDSGLSRSGLSDSEYRQLAEKFAVSLDMTPQWIYVDGAQRKIETLLAGGGDLIASNLTNTKSRQQQVRFGQALKTVNEVIVTRAIDAIKGIEDLKGYTLFLPQGTSYHDTASQYLSKHKDAFEIVTLAADTSNRETLRVILDNKRSATILDSDIAASLVNTKPELKIILALKLNRKLAWAVRPESPELLDKLNHFLTEQHISSTANKPILRDWQAIKASGQLRMLTLNNPSSYFMYKGELMGFDYDLMRKFSQDNGLHISVIVKNSIPELLNSLRSGEGDVVAASLTATQERQTGGVVFSKRYLSVSPILVGRVGEEIDSQSGLDKRTVGINPDTSFKQLIHAIQGHDVEVYIKQVQKSTENLMAMVASNKIDYTLADSHLAAIELSHNDNLSVALELPDKQSIAWALRDSQPILMSKLNSFIGKHYRGLFYNVTFNKYFKHKSNIKSQQAGRTYADVSLSPYDDLIEVAAKEYGMDKRLITAQMYQESKFNPNAKSFAGALGLMQVMPRTGRELGYENLTDPSTGLNAGVAYLDWLVDRFPGDMAPEERIFFILAAYNAGIGHVRDARRLAGQLDLNPDKWFGHTELAMLKLSDKQYYQHARYGYVRGGEPVTYVRKIRDRYIAYLNLSDKKVD
jgi:membrane-bound lytic murein transglycosylase F